MICFQVLHSTYHNQYAIKYTSKLLQSELRFHVLTLCVLPTNCAHFVLIGLHILLWPNLAYWSSFVYSPRCGLFGGHPTPGNQHPASGTQRLAPNTRLWHPATGTLHLAVWPNPAPNTRHPTHSAATKQPATCSLHPATQISGPKNWHFAAGHRRPTPGARHTASAPGLWGLTPCTRKPKFWGPKFGRQPAQKMEHRDPKFDPNFVTSRSKF